MRTGAVALLLTLATILVVLVLRRRSTTPATELGSPATIASVSAQYTGTASAPSEPPQSSVAPPQDTPAAASQVPVSPSGAAVSPSSRPPRETHPSSPNVAETAAPRLDPAGTGRLDDLKDPYKKK